MSLPRWIEVNLNTVLVPDSGWHYDDDATMSKLASSLQRHGQLEPLVVRGVVEDESMVTLVKGHKLLGAMLTLGWTKAMAVHVGDVTPVQALKIALHLELKFEVDYVRLATAVAEIVAAGATAAEVASGSPFDTERIQHLLTLRTHDWNKFGVDDGQAKLDWDALEVVPDLPPPLAVVQTAPPGVHIEPPIIPVPLTDKQLHAALDAAADVLDHHREATTPEMLATAMAEALEDVTDAPVPAPAPAAPPVAGPAPAEQAAATQAEPETQPVKAAKAKPAKPAKVPKAPDAQLGLF